MIVDHLIKQSGSWLSMRRDTGIVISSRVRLARNLAGVPFPSWADKEERQGLCRRMKDVFLASKVMSNVVYFEMSRLSAVEKEILKERHLTSNEFVHKGAGSGLVVADQERVAIMVNEEDHLRFQSMSPGLNLWNIWRRIDEIDTETEASVEYAFAPALGYLTACPSNVGTGLRASVMMHLVGLTLMGEVDSVIRGLNRIGVEVRGILGEGTDAFGNMFQISNRTTLGRSEAQIIESLIATCRDLVGHERNARLRLQEQRPAYLLDHVSRSLGVLMSAHVLTSVEAVNLLSGLRLGVEFEVMRNLSVVQVNRLMLLSQPGHLQKLLGRTVPSEERDRLRAVFIRRELRSVRMCAPRLRGMIRPVVRRDAVKDGRKRG